jgi:hypothetical protein
VDIIAATQLGAPMISPTHIRVSREEYGLTLWMRKGRKTITKLKEKAFPYWEKEIKRIFR